MKPTKYMEQCMYHYIDQEDYDAGFNVSESLCIDDVVAQVKKMRKHPNRSIHWNDELDSFSHVARIQESLLKSDKDKYLVYKWECCLMGGMHSYVFKTSAVSLKVASMMAGKVKVGGQDSTLHTEPAFFDGMHTRVKFFVSLTLWVFHPAMRMMLLLALLKRDGVKSTAKKELNPPRSSSPHDIHIDLTESNIQPSCVNELMRETPQNSRETEIDVTGKPEKFCQPKIPKVLIDLTALSSNASASNAFQQVFTYDSEPVSSDNTSFLSNSSSSTSRQKPRKFEKVKIDEERMRRAPVKIVEEVPWDLSGDCVYKIKCTEENWIQKYEDGRWFYLRNSTRNGLRSHQKTGKCFGSFICQRGNCPKLTAEDIVNTINFRQVGKGSYVCTCCSHPAERIYCGVIKAVEFD